MSFTNKEPKLNEDLQFLIACCQRKPSEDDIRFVTSYLSQTTDHSSLITTALQHGILPLVYKMIKNVSENNDNSASLNPKILTELKAHYMGISQNNMSMSAELIKIMKLFQKNDIKALSFKGPSLAQLAYSDITLRQFGDLDILIKKEEIKKVEKLCISMGYKPYYDLTKTQKEVWYTYAKDMVFYHPQKKHHLEMHWLLLDADFPLQLDLDSVWEEQNIVEINKNEVKTFSSEFLLLYLCIHGSKHFWERIIWIKDIDLMIRTQTIDLERVILESKKSNSKVMLFLGLYLSKMLFDTPLPKQIELLLEKETVLPTLSNFVFTHWKRPISIFQNTKAMLTFFPTFTMKVRYLHKVILKPSHNEYRFIDLPKGLYWVYYLVRPYLLIKKYLSKNQ